MKRSWLLYIAHVAALAFGLGGILIAVPNPDLWAGSDVGIRVFRFGMDYGGATHIIFGALTLLAFGSATIGWRKTLIFFAIAVPVSLSAELIGTTTGLPFGEYAYTSGLGMKVLDRVPFTIPLSWFYLGLTSYLLGLSFARRYFPRRRSLAGVVAGVYLLVVWDLVLDPAMAHEAMPVKFWQWFDTGPYFGMPVINFLGWALTGTIFIGLARLAWRADPASDEIRTTLPYFVYVANMIFAMVLSLSVDLWEPVVIALVLGVLPATIAWLSQQPAAQPVTTGNTVTQRVLATGGTIVARRHGEVTIEQIESVPDQGPCILVCRHYHHLYDGCALYSAIRRPIHILVGLDWIRNGLVRHLMERACHAAGWPVVLRIDGLARGSNQSAYSAREARSYLRRATQDSIHILSSGEILVVFPEAYPNVDPTYSPKSAPGEFLPFQSGFARIAQIAEKRLGRQIPLVPVGFEYKHAGQAEIVVRFGQPAYLSQFASVDDAVAQLERRVISLSKPRADAIKLDETRVAAS